MGRIRIIFFIALWPCLASQTAAPPHLPRASAMASMEAFQTLDLAAGLAAASLPAGAVALGFAAIPAGFLAMLRLRYHLRQHFR